MFFRDPGEKRLYRICSREKGSSLSTTREEDLKKEKVYYNYKFGPFPVNEGPAISVFAKHKGKVYHTYSTYARGLDMLNGAYHYLDLVPKGRDEEKLPWTMAWLKHHDKYEKKP